MPGSAVNVGPGEAVQRIDINEGRHATTLSSYTKRSVSEVSAVRGSHNVTDLERGGTHQRFEKIEKVLEQSRRINKKLIPKHVSLLQENEDYTAQGKEEVYEPLMLQEVGSAHRAKDRAWQYD